MLPVKQFINHQWKQAVRSPIFEKNLATNILIGFFILLMFIEIAVLSIYISSQWHEIIKDGKPITEFHKIVGWYLALMFVFRFFLQKLPAMEIRPYQHLPIGKNTLLHFLLLRGAINLFTLTSVLFFLPFAIFQVHYYHGTALATAWVISMFFIDLALNYFVIYLKKQMVVSLKVVSVLLFFLIVLAMGDYFGWYSFATAVGWILDQMLLKPQLLLLSFVLFGIVYAFNFVFLKNRMYLEELIPQSETMKSQPGNIGYLRKFGLTGEMISLDIRLNLRNKRTKSMLYMAPLFLLYGLIFYPTENLEKDSGLLIFVGIFMSAGVMINYLQYAFAYEGGFFDYLLTSGLNFSDYVKAKLLLGSFVVAGCFILTIPYVFYGMEILLINFACFLFNLGIITPAILYFATYNKKTMVLSKGSAFNYQGVGISHFLTMLPVFLVPLMIYQPLKWLGYAEYGIAVIGVLGLISLAFRKFYIHAIVANLEQRKYIMATGFRAKN